jgi:hypothetical protein
LKTTLPSRINSVDEAKAFLDQLIMNDEYYHPEEDALEVRWTTLESDHPTEDQCVYLNKLMADIYLLPECDPEMVDDELYMEFDPCLYILDNINKEII